MRVLALDLGEKNIGLSLSDQLGWTAQGLPSLRRKSLEEDICALTNIVKENNVQEIVVGLPISMSGNLGRKAKEVAKFAQHLEKVVDLPIKLWDERLTSVQAEKVLIQADLSRKKRKSKIDQLAAQLILQSYLDTKTKPNVDVQKDSLK